MAKFVAKFAGPHSLVIPEKKLTDSLGNIIRFVPQKNIDFAPGIGFDTEDENLISELEGHAYFNKDFVRVDGAFKVTPVTQAVKLSPNPVAPSTVPNAVKIVSASAKKQKIVDPEPEKEEVQEEPEDEDEDIKL